MSTYYLVISGKQVVDQKFSNVKDADLELDPTFDGERDGRKWKEMSGIAIVNSANNSFGFITRNCSFDEVGELKRAVREYIDQKTGLFVNTDQERQMGITRK